MSNKIGDAPSGSYKNHALSNKIRKAAIPECKFAAFAKPEPGYGKHKGETLTITRYKNVALPATGVIAEDDYIPQVAVQIAVTPITVNEYGSSIPYTSLMEELSFYDVTQPIQAKLKDQMKQVVDTAAAAAFKGAYALATPTGLGTITWQTTPVPCTTPATVNINATIFGLIRDYMQQTLWAPWYEDESYVGLISTNGCRGVKSDPDFVGVAKYADPEKLLYRSEIGTLEDIRVVEINRTAVLSGTKGTGSVLGEGVIFGDDAVALIEAETPELRAAIPGDYGRKKGIAWYGILQFGLVWPSSSQGEGRVVYITSQ